MCFESCISLSKLAWSVGVGSLSGRNLRGGCGSDQVAIRGKSLELARLLEARGKFKVAGAPDRDRSQPRWSDRAVIERVDAMPPW